jgi:putative ABC transport system ATP-binding protein
MAMIEKTEKQSIDSANGLQNENGFLKLVNLSKCFMEAGRKRIVLDHVSLELDKGAIMAVLGKSGSGKTTLLNLIGGIDLADGGDITINGFQLTDLKDHDRTIFRRCRIGFIFQFFNLIPTLTVWENVVLPLELNRLLDENGRTRALALLDEVGLADRLNTFPDRLSGGEQQRVAVARALVHDPVLVLADEPTGNLDEETGRQVMALIESLVRKTGKTLIMVTHSLEAAAIADRVFQLRDGQLVERAV